MPELHRSLKKEGYLPIRASILRKLLDYKQTGQPLDLWLAYPQTLCCFSFGANNKPLPIGALFLLWSAGWPYKQECPECKSDVYMISFGGLLSYGGGHLICPICNNYWFQFLGGLGQVAMEYINKSPIVGTEFKTSSLLFGGAFTSEGKELRKLLDIEEPLENLKSVSLTLAVKDITGEKDDKGEFPQNKVNICQTLNANPVKFYGGLLFERR